MSEWRELEAGWELDRYIAELMGYSVFELNPQNAVIDRQCYTLLDPNKKPIEDGDDTRIFADVFEKRVPIHVIGDDIDELWEESADEGFVPPYSRSVDAALALPIPQPITFFLYRTDWVEDDERWFAEIGDRPNSISGFAPTAALAICRAWLAWRDTQE